MRADAAVLEDLGSKNGTCVNDRPLRGPTPVADGDQVWLDRSSSTASVIE